MSRGTVKWFNSQKGYGSIQPQGGGENVFIHISAVEKAGLSGLNEGQVVEFEEVADKQASGLLRGAWVHAIGLRAQEFFGVLN